MTDVSAAKPYSWLHIPEREIMIFGRPEMEDVVKTLGDRSSSLLDIRYLAVDAE